MGDKWRKAELAILTSRTGFEGRRYAIEGKRRALGGKNPERFNEGSMRRITSLV